MPRPIEIAFRAGDVTLAGELILPDEAPFAPAGRRPRFPWTLLVPGDLPRDRDGALDRHRHPAWFAPTPMPAAPPGLLARLARSLAERGVASFRYDVRGCGRSEGDWAASDLFTRIDDARDALGAMRGRRELDLARTGVVGQGGEGAAIALSVAIADPAISALTLIAPAARSPRDLLRRAVGERSRTGIDREHPVVASLDRSSEELIERVARHEPSMSLRLAGGTPSVSLNLAAFDQAFATPPMALATMLHRSVALVHGTADVWTDPDESRLLSAILRSAGNDPGLRLVEGAGHDLAEAPDTVIEEIGADLANRIEARPLPPVLVALDELES